jgi:hypothetical protein
MFPAMLRYLEASGFFGTLASSPALPLSADEDVGVPRGQ